MLGIYATAALVIAAAALTGEAACRVSGWRPWRPWAGAVGLALVISVTGAAIQLPGRDVASIVALALLCAASLFALRRGPRPHVPRELVGVAVAVAAATLVPFAVNGRAGALGVGYNNDLATHLSYALALLGESTANPAGQGYPVGPHSLVATVSGALGTDLDVAFTGLAIAVPVLTVGVAAALLSGLTRPRRAVAVAVVALAYLSTAYLVQDGFKETLLGLFVLAFAATLAELRRGGAPKPRQVVVLGILLAGSLYVFSYGGPVWLVATLAAWVALELAAGRLSPRATLARLRRELGGRALRRALLLGLVGLAVLALPVLPRTIDFLRSLSLSPAGSGAIATENLGNLSGPVPAVEAIGLWPSEDFRFSPGPQRELILVPAAILALLYGLWWWLRRRRFAVPAALVAAALVFVFLTARESPYIAAKGLVVGAPIVAVLVMRALLDRPDPPVSGARRAVALAGVAFAGVALWSSFLALLGGQVGGIEHHRQLSQLRPLLRGEPTLFAGNDDYVGWELRGVPLSVPPETTQTLATPRVQPRREKRWRYGMPFDFDSFTSRSLDEFRYLVTSNTDFASVPPANWRVVGATGLYHVFERHGPTPPRRVLEHGGAPGAVLDCSTPPGRRISKLPGRAFVRDRPRVKRLSIQLRASDRDSFDWKLPAGRWQLSIQYAGGRALKLQASGFRTHVPANLGRRGAYFSIGTFESDGTLRRFLVRPDQGGLIRPTGQATKVTRLAAVRRDGVHRFVPLARACGRYVDFYEVGRARRGT